MTEADKLFEKLQTMKLEDLLNVCAQMLDGDIDEKRTDIVFQILEMRLQKRRMCKQLGIKE